MPWVGPPRELIQQMSVEVPPLGAEPLFTSLRKLEHNRWITSRLAIPGRTRVACPVASRDGSEHQRCYNSERCGQASVPFRAPS
jgi:hypothetical protein